MCRPKGRFFFVCVNFVRPALRASCTKKGDRELEFGVSATERRENKLVATLVPALPIGVESSCSGILQPCLRAVCTAPYCRF